MAECIFSSELAAVAGLLQLNLEASAAAESPLMEVPPGKIVNPPTERVSLRFLAKRLGLTHATVSMALRGLPRVAEKTRRRILEEAARCGYRPDPMLSALAAYRQDKRAPGYRGHLAWLHNPDFPAPRLTQTFLHQNPYFGLDTKICG